MEIVPAVRQVIQQFLAQELHAARSGREVMNALAQTARYSTATSVASLALDVQVAVDAILSVMPAYAPPLNVLHRILAHVETALASNVSPEELRTTIVNDAENFLRWSEAAREQTANYGAALIPDGSTVFTFTLSETALRTLRQAAEHGKHFRVLVTESRPNHDGLNTARELAAMGVEAQVSIDACIGLLMPHADLMMVGAEAIMADGSAVAKIGTYPTALMAARYGVPVYVVVDTLKFNVSSMLGLGLKLDSIRREDVLPSDMPSDVTVVGHLFDCTPDHLIRGIVTERGVVSPAACSALMREMPISYQMKEKLGRL